MRPAVLRATARRAALPFLLLSLAGARAEAQSAERTAERPAERAADPLARLAWLAGCWEGRAGARSFEEHWLPLRAGTLVGASRSTRAAPGDTVTTGTELAIIRLRGDTVVYEAHPVGQPPAVFPAVALDGGGATFSNPAHDFPQRILYRRAGADSLVARIEGEESGRTHGVDYPMRRVVCPVGRD